MYCWKSTNYFFFFFFLFPFYGRTCGLWNFPGQGWNWSCSCTPQPQQHWIRAASSSYTPAWGNMGSLTQWARSGIKAAISQRLCHVLNPTEPLQKCHTIFLFFFCLFAFSRAAPLAYGGSQARGQIRAVSTSLRHSHSNVRSEPHLWPTPQLTATPDP